MIVAGRKIERWKGIKKSEKNLRQTGKQQLQSKFPTSVVMAFLPKSGHLGSKLLVMALNAGVCTVRYGRPSAAIHFPIDLLTRWYAAVSMP